MSALTNGNNQLLVTVVTDGETSYAWIAEASHLFSYLCLPLMPDKYNNIGRYVFIKCVWNTDSGSS